MTTDVNEKTARQKRLARRLVSALQEDEFVLYCQAIVPPSPGQVHRPFQELLIRFREEEAKLLPPGLFFPLLEDFRLLPYVDRWVVSRITQWIRAARAVKHDWVVPRNNINLSPDTLYDPHFGEFTRRHIQNADLPAGALSFEITWPDAIRHAESLRSMAALLKDAGCGFTVADFDGSEDAFATLEEFTPDFIKISSGIVRNLEPDASDSVAVELIHSRCHSLGIGTIAECVESDALRQRLVRIGVNYVQGFGVSVPRPLI
jgi:EAL domain-containing protein (putative c-di-GMP-specific phosphodiesterase class I)